VTVLSYQEVRMRKSVAIRRVIGVLGIATFVDGRRVARMPEADRIRCVLSIQ